MIRGILVKKLVVNNDAQRMIRGVLERRAIKVQVSRKRHAGKKTSKRYATTRPRRISTEKAPKNLGTESATRGNIGLAHTYGCGLTTNCNSSTLPPAVCLCSNWSSIGVSTDDTLAQDIGAKERFGMLPQKKLGGCIRE